MVPPIKAGLRLRIMLGSRPRQDADASYAVVLLRKSSDRRYDRRAAWSEMILLRIVIPLYPFV
jgi:hypothetical protein